MPDQAPQITVLVFKSYIQAIKNSVGTNLFRNLYAKVGDVEQDILKDGELSCAAFVSNILLMFQLIGESHATVAGTVKDLQACGWVEIDKPREGAILVWEKSAQDSEGNLHEHIGFYLGDNQAISNNSTKKTPQQHYWTFAEEYEDTFRKVTALYWNPKLEQ